MLAEFIQYLKEQIGQPYVWGGQHLKLTPDNYEAVIHKREDGRGKYADGTTYADASIAYCRKLFKSGATVLYAYDCSGLGMYWLQNLQHLYPDMTADGMMHKCEGVTRQGEPKRGWWVFRLTNSRATHIGYMIDDSYLIEAKGRKFGVVKSKFKKSDWTQWGIPKVFYDEIVNPEPPQPTPPEPPEPEPPKPEPKQKVMVIAGSVRVRKGDGILSKTLFIAHNRAWYKAHGFDHDNDKFDLIDIAKSGWYHIDTVKGPAYITNKPKYTRLVEE